MRTQQEEKAIADFIKSKGVRRLPRVRPEDNHERAEGRFCAPKHPISGLSHEEQALITAIRRAVWSGDDHVEVAKEFGVPLGYVYKWCATRLSSVVRHG